MPRFAPAPYDHEFTGFYKARHALLCHESRARTWQRLNLTDLLDNQDVIAVHVNHVTYTAGDLLVGFDSAGQVIGSDTLFTDIPDEHIGVTPEFDHDYTQMSIPEGSPLAEYVARGEGWVIDMAALRRYDIVADRRLVQRQIFLTNMADMHNNGSIQLDLNE